MFVKMIAKSTLHRPAALLWTALALTSCAALITLFVTIRLQIGPRMTSDFTRLGANAVITLKSPNTSSDMAAQRLAWPVVEKVATGSHIQLALLHLRVGLIQGVPVGIVAGLSRQLRVLTPYWQIAGQRPQMAGDCLVGNRVAKRLGLKSGGSIGVSWGTDRGGATWRIVGILGSGDDDESRIFVTAFGAPDGLHRASGAAGASSPIGGSFRGGVFTYGLLAVPGGPTGIASFSSALSREHLPFEIQPLRQILYGEQTVLAKVELLCGVTLAAVLVLTVLGLSAAVLAHMLERAREISLMRALGAKRRWVVAFLIAESGCHGILAGLVGFWAGSLLARQVGRQVFQVSFSPQVWALAITIVATVLVAIFGAVAGIRRALQLQPAMLLRSE